MKKIFGKEWEREERKAEGSKIYRCSECRVEINCVVGVEGKEENEE